MSVLTKKQTDSFCSLIKKIGTPIWQDVAITQGYDLKELSKTINKYHSEQDKCTPAQIYFVESLEQSLAAINVKHFDKVVSEPGGARLALELGSPRYSLKYKDYVRKTAFSFLEALKEEVGQDSQIYLNVLKRLADKTSEQEVVRISEILSEYSDDM